MEPVAAGGKAVLADCQSAHEVRLNELFWATAFGIEALRASASIC
jgi:hypothetical protein